jgi:catechol 2,3-dioxygenase-like lactoylglutathione lyase family enzyme
MPEITGIKETCLYVNDLARAVAFYERVLALRRMAGDERFCALSVADNHVLLLFKKGASNQVMPVPGGAIPPHDSDGPAHIGFAIPSDSLAGWERVLAENGVAIESRVTWPRGGRSIYFRDPDGHAVEFLTPGVWPIY